MSICTHSKKVCRLGNILDVEGSKREPVVVTSKQGFEPLEGEAKASFFCTHKYFATMNIHLGTPYIIY